MLIQLDNVTKIFNQGKPNEFSAVRNLSLTIEANKVTCLKGPSGSGKTTLLSMIGCLSRPTSGRIKLNGKNMSGLPEHFLTQIRRETFGFIFQDFNLIQGLTVLENVMLPAYPMGVPYTELVDSAKQLLRQFNIEDKINFKTQWLSGGEAQRVVICRALINNPKILIADEPTANLDTKLSNEFLVLLAELRKAGKTILITSHDSRVYNSPIIEKAITLRDGIVTDAA